MWGVQLTFKRVFGGSRLLAAASFVVGSAAGAQDVGQALPSREQIELPAADQPRLPARIDVGRAAPAGPCPFASSTVSADLRHIRFTGPDGAALPAVIADALAPVQIAPGLQPVSSLCTVRDRANERLATAGYIASVQIPPQEITAGEAVLHVTLARLTAVEVKGAPGPYAKTIAARAAQLQALEPFNRLAAERILLVAGDVPGLDVGLSLRPAGTAPGEVIGDLVVRYAPLAIVVNAQNSGSRVIGRTTGTVRAEYYGLTGLSDRTFLGLSSTTDFKEQIAVQGGHYMGDAKGRTAGLRLSYAESRPDVGALDLRARSLLAGLEFAAPLVRAVTRNVSAGGGLELIDQRVRIGTGNNALPVTRDKLQILFATLSGAVRKPRYDGADALSLGGTLEVRQGLNVVDAGRASGAAPSRLQGNRSATVIRAGAEGFASAGLFSVQAIAQGQVASDPLLSIEEFSVGNLTLGRGFDPGVTSGDHALGFRIEPRVQLPIRAAIGAQLFAFHDRVRIWNLDNFTFEDRRTLRSWGAGGRLVLPGRFVIEAMYARPQDRGLATDARRAPDRFLVSLTTQFSPAR